MLPELSHAEKEQLEENLKRDGCLSPIVLWGNVILDGHHRYEICVRNNIPFETIQMEFAQREEALRWICINQIGRRNTSMELVKYQIGKRYNAEKVLRTVHNPRGKNQYTPEDPSENLIDPKDRSFGTAGIMAKEYGVSPFAIHTYKDIAKQVDKIAEKDPRLVDMYLSGSMRIKRADLEIISEMQSGQIKALTNNLIRQKKTSCKSEDLLESLAAKNPDSESRTARERRQAQAASNQPSIKDMPEFDPDGEVTSLSLTIPSWCTSIERVFQKSNMKEVSNMAKKQLHSGLLQLRDNVELVLLAIEEEMGDE